MWHQGFMPNIGDTFVMPKGKGKEETKCIYLETDGPKMKQKAKVI